MMKTILIKKRLKLTLLLAISLLAISTGVPALTYLSVDRLRIVSEYSSNLDDSSVYAHSRIWEVIPQTAPDGSYLLQFFPEASGSVAPVCELKISFTDSADEIRWQGMGKVGEKVSLNGLLVVPGFPAPCDILPVTRNDADKIYVDKNEAGGRVFLQKYRIFRNEVSLETSRKNGWVKVNILNPVDLHMIRVVDELDHLVVKQLWTSGGSWWIYEETPFRRSWLIR